MVKNICLSGSGVILKVKHFNGSSFLSIAESNRSVTFLFIFFLNSCYKEKLIIRFKITCFYNYGKRVLLSCTRCTCVPPYATTNTDYYVSREKTKI